MGDLIFLPLGNQGGEKITLSKAQGKSVSGLKGSTASKTNLFILDIS